MYKTQRGFEDVQDAVRLSDRGYVGILGVYHSLHFLVNYLYLARALDLRLRPY